MRETNSKINGLEIEKDELDAKFRALRRNLFDLVEASWPEGQQADAAKRQVKQMTQRTWDQLCDLMGLPRNYTENQHEGK